MATYALAGNPNSGKTSLFNLLTGTRQYVGNWPGVTVEKKVGYLKGNQSEKVVDLPGIYSISPFSIEEKVASQFLVNEEFDTLINIVDSSNIERNMYFTVQLLELGKPMIVALNMIDVADTYGIKIDSINLQKKLGVPITPMKARKGEGVKELLEVLKKDINPPNFKIDYGLSIEQVVEKIVFILKEIPELKEFNFRWLAIQLLEGNTVIKEKIPSDQLKKIESLIEAIELTAADEIRTKRYAWIRNLINQVMVVEKKENKTWTDKIDAIVTNKWLGIPLFLFFMFLTFQITFTWIGTPLQDILDGFMSGPLSDGAIKLLNLIGATDWLKQLVVNGIIAGVGGVLVFVPQIFVLFLIISFLEDSGYMARAAFIMDKAMGKMGLNGKAFIPMIVGFGCNVPGIMATRTMEQPKERLITILLSPFMSCSARLAVYALFVSVFFQKYQSLIVLSLYLLGIIIAILLGIVFKHFLLKEEESLFVIELPPYRVPMVRSLLLNTWDKGKNFIKKAGTVIFSMAVLMWFLANFSWTGMVNNMNDSFLANLGGIIAPVFSPLGFGTWESGVALISGFMAKEIVVSTMSIVYGVGGESISQLGAIIQSAFNPVSAYAFMVFVLLYTPCMATLVTMKKETGSWKWPIFSVVYSFVTAWVIAFIVYQVGKLLFL